MMHLFWVTLLWMQPLVSGSDLCSVPVNNNAHTVSPLLESLQCYNDYESSMNCSWRADGSAALQLWVQSSNQRKLCVQRRPPGPDGTVQCWIESKVWAIGIKHTFFFLKNQTLDACSYKNHRAASLSQHLSPRPPLNLTAHDTGNGGTRVAWSSPYPPSSPLSKTLTYQLRYRTHTQDNWTTKDVNDTHLTLEKDSLLPGHRYDAKVRSRASVGQWSGWTPVVTWQTQDRPGHPPRLHCVLEAETEVVCSWEMSRDLAQFISYQLIYKVNHQEGFKSCSMNLAVSSDVSGSVLRYSCSLSVADPANLLLKLEPTHSTKTLDPNKHIRPKPPKDVKLKEKGNDWVLEWSKLSTGFNLYYQVCYYRTQHQEHHECKNTVDLHYIIPGALLVPSQEYQVKVRSLVVPGSGSKYQGIPSEWANPEKWTSHPASWTITYVLTGLFVAGIFIICYCTCPTCHRRIILWVESVPSPGKSKILSEIKSATSRPLMQNEDTSICKVLHFDTISTCSSNASLWPMKEPDTTCLEPDEGVWNCENLSVPAEKVSSSDTSSMSFSGPYIFCQTSKKSVDMKCKDQVKEDKASSENAPSPVNLGIFGEGYVCLPSRTMSRSTQDLVSHSAEQDQQRPDASPWTGTGTVQPDLGHPTSGGQPPAYTAEAFSPWPPGDHVQASGYCFLPQPT